MRFRRLALTLPSAVALSLAAQQPRVTEQQSGVTALLQSISAVDENTAWIGGASGTVLRTRDGGTTWERRPIPGGDRLEFRGIHALSANEAWAMSAGSGGASRIFHTTDGGTTWTPQFVNGDSTAFYDCITFFDSKHGVAYSDMSQGRTVVLRTQDGGAHWGVLPVGSVPAPLKGEGGFASSNSCAVSVDSKHGWIAASIPEARVFRTADAGATWAAVPTATPFVHAADAGLTALSFRDAKHGIGVAARVNRTMNTDTASAAVAITEDGGITWTLRTRPGRPGALSGVALVPKASDRTAVIASYGGLFVSRDLGATWTAATEHSYWAVRAAGKRAWGIGTGGRITRLDF